MAKPLSRACRTRFKVGKPAVLIVHGDNFGNTGDQVQVTLDGGDLVTWNPSPAPGTVLTDTKLVRVKSTPGAKDGKEIVVGAGGGDLTITVTNGDGTTSNSQVQSVYYDTDD